MTAPAAAPADEVTLAVEEVRSAATGLVITTPLRRLTAAGLIAAPRSRGRGRGGGREYRYPARVLDQLAAVAEARVRSHRYEALRHAVWWRPQGRLEDWRLWQRDRLIELAAQSQEWALLAAQDDGLSPEREEHLTAVAQGLRRPRMQGLPRTRLHTLADMETYVRVWTSVLFWDDLLVVPFSDGADEHWRRVAAEPVDSDEEVPVGGTMGQLFQRGVGWPLPRSGSTGFGALASAAFVPHPAIGWAILASMTEERAMLLRDAVLELAARNGSANVLREQPLFAAIALVTVETFATAFPEIVERLPAA